MKISKVIFENNLSKKLFRIILFLFIIKVISISIFSFLAQTAQVTTTPVTTTTTFYRNNFVCPVLDGCCFPNPLTNISFLQCISGTPYAFNCTLNGTYWVNATQTCEHPTTTTTTCPTTTTTYCPRNFLCSSLNSCCNINPLTNTSFIMCVNGVPVCGNCPSGSYWVNDTQACGYPYKI